MVHIDLRYQDVVVTDQNVASFQINRSKVSFNLLSLCFHNDDSRKLPYSGRVHNGPGVITHF